MPDYAYILTYMYIHLHKSRCLNINWRVKQQLILNDIACLQLDTQVIVNVYQVSKYPISVSLAELWNNVMLATLHTLWPSSYTFSYTLGSIHMHHPFKVEMVQTFCSQKYVCCAIYLQLFRDETYFVYYYLIAFILLY